MNKNKITGWQDLFVTMFISAIITSLMFGFITNFDPIFLAVAPVFGVIIGLIVWAFRRYRK